MCAEMLMSGDCYHGVGHGAFYKATGFDFPRLACSRMLPDSPVLPQQLSTGERLHVHVTATFGNAYAGVPQGVVPFSGRS